MNKLSKRHFWEWFKRNNKEYAELNKKTKKEAVYLVNELNAHLRAYYKFFGFSLAWEENRKSTLTITVDAKARYFKKAEAFVATAPEITGWKIIALDEPKSIDFFLEELITKSGIHPQEFYFSIDNDDPGCVSITVYHPLCTKENENLLYRSAHQAIYNLLGERSFGTDVHYIDVANLSCANSYEIFKLDELPAMLDLLKSSTIVDERGNLVTMY